MHTPRVPAYLQGRHAGHPGEYAVSAYCTDMQMHATQGMACYTAVPGMHASPGNSLIGGVSTTYGAKHRVMGRDFFSALCIPSLTAYSAGVCMLPGY